MGGMGGTNGKMVKVCGVLVGKFVGMRADLGVDGKVMLK
jgi:hypothetical protein